MLEIGLEEIPARMIAGAEAELGRRVNDLLTRERLLASGAKVTTYSTPRRLAVLVEGVLASQADTEEQLTGPSWKVAFKDGAPTLPPRPLRRRPASLLRLSKKSPTPRASMWARRSSGRAAQQRSCWPPSCPKKSSASTGPRICTGARASRSALCGPCAGLSRCSMRRLCPLEIAGIKAGNASRGHRILHGEAPVVIDQRDRLRRSVAQGICGGRCRRAQAVDSQGSRRGHAHRSRRALARR